MLEIKRNKFQRLKRNVYPPYIFLVLVVSKQAFSLLASTNNYKQNRETLISS